MKGLTKDEIQRLLVRVDKPRDKLLIQLGLVLGCRVSEIVTIRLKNIEEGRIKLWDEKKDVFRYSVIDRETVGMLSHYLAYEWKPKPHVPHQLFYFGTKTANRILKGWFKEAKLPPEKAHWHTLRHTNIVQSLDAGVPINHVCAQTGDSPTTVIEVYGAPSIDSRIDMLEKKGVYWK